MQGALGNAPKLARPPGAKQNSNIIISCQIHSPLECVKKFRSACSELTYTVEGSDDMITWSSIAANPGTAGETVTVTDTAPTSAKKRFIRLKVAR